MCMNLKLQPINEITTARTPDNKNQTNCQATTATTTTTLTADLTTRTTIPITIASPVSTANFWDISNKNASGEP